MNWFLCKVRFDKVQENGLIKKVTEPYLVDALSFTEAEARICKEVQPYVSGDFVVSGVTRQSIADFVHNDKGGYWHKAKVNLVVIDENKGVEKRIAQNYWVQEEDLYLALLKLDSYMQDTLGDWEIVAIAQTNVLDVYPYEAQEEE